MHGHPRPRGLKYVQKNFAESHQVFQLKLLHNLVAAVAKAPVYQSSIFCSVRGFETSVRLKYESNFFLDRFFHIFFLQKQKGGVNKPCRHISGHLCPSILTLQNRSCAHIENSSLCKLYEKNLHIYLFDINFSDIIFSFHMTINISFYFEDSSDNIQFF